MVLPLNTFVTPFFVHNRTYVGDNLRLMRNGFSARHKYRRDTSDCYNVMKWIQHCWNRGIMAFTHRNMGHTLNKWILHIFSNGWMDCRDAFVVLCSYYCVQTEQNIAACKLFWLMNFPIINNWGALAILCSASCAII